MCVCKKVIYEVLIEGYLVEAMTLTDEIFRIKEDMTVTLSTFDGPITFNYYKNDTKNTEILKQEKYE